MSHIQDVSACHARGGQLALLSSATSAVLQAVAQAPQTVLLLAAITLRRSKSREAHFTTCT